MNTVFSVRYLRNRRQAQQSRNLMLHGCACADHVQPAVHTQPCYTNGHAYVKCAHAFLMCAG